MLNTIYRLSGPRKFEIEFSEIDLKNDSVVVRPTHLSICNADQRYYQGRRDPKVLKEKLPMALIHEAIGEVVYDRSGEYKKGDMVVMIPNTPVEKDEYIAENYLRSSKFRASGFDGFMQDNIVMPKDRVIKLPQDIDKNVASFTEIISVAYHAVDRFIKFSHGRKDTLAIWGDGNLAFIVALILKYRLPESKVHIVGVDGDKLELFAFADETYFAGEFPEDFIMDHAFECVGGENSSKAVNQIIDYIKPEGCISVLGVSENLVPINTRMILEKGLILFGSSRSGRKEFQDTVDFYKAHPEAVAWLSHIVGQVVDVRNMENAKEAFEKDIHKAFGKTIMLWNV